MQERDYLSLRRAFAVSVRSLEKGHSLVRRQYERERTHRKRLKLQGAVPRNPDRKLATSKKRGENHKGKKHSPWRGRRRVSVPKPPSSVQSKTKRKCAVRPEEGRFERLKKMIEPYHVLTASAQRE